MAKCHYEMNVYERGICNWSKQIEMNCYSTATQRLKKTKELTLLSQQCSDIDCGCINTWMVMGNCFSLHESHDLNISTFNSWGRCCVFGVEFDPSSKKVICALSAGCLVLHDLEKKLNWFSLPYSVAF